jgi:23S rRNA (uracil1939-C5)-methyltransferase
MPAITELSIQKGAEIEVAITSVTFGGQGVARINDFVLFVDGAVTGDIVRAKVLRLKKNFAEARTTQILTPSPHRTEAPCHYFGTCGGCRWQDVDYQGQLEFKRQNIVDVFQRIGGFRDMEVPSPIGSPKIFHYRNKMEFTFGDRPWLTEAVKTDLLKPSFALGLHVSQRFDKVLDVKDCYLQSPLANQILNFINVFAKSSGLAPYSLHTHEGFWRFLVIREMEHTPDLMVNIITSREDPVMNFLKEKIVKEFPKISSLINGISQKKSQIAVSDYEIVLHGQSTILEKLGGCVFEISSNSFFQTNTLAAEVLYGTILKMAGLKGNETVFDLYCGTGSIAITLAPHAKKIIGIELSESAIANAEKNMLRNQVSNCQFIHGDIRATLKLMSEKPDVVILDPPRSGLHGDVVETLREILPETMIYVSCNPSTQARDLELLCRDRYAMTQIQPVDLFPHTYHIENVVKLVRN